MQNVLWVDDDQDLIGDLAEYLSGEGYAVDCAYDLAGARSRLAEQAYDLVIVDIGLPDGSGLSLVKETPRSQAREFVVLTGHGSVNSAIEAIRHKAFDYLMKPIELTELKNVLARVRKSNEAAKPDEAASSRRDPAAAPRRPRSASNLMLGKSPAMQHVQLLVDRVATSEITVLIQGESGTGKEVAAQSLHQLSSRSAAPFIALNCAALSPSLIASELFGHEKGSFTGAFRTHKGLFERAEGGTLFLDEITEMPIELQANLLRVLETGRVGRVGGDAEIPVNVRVIAATNRDPLRAVEQGTFRLDLYYRLQVFPIELPPLRERGDDVLSLAGYFLGIFGVDPNDPLRKPPTLSPQTALRLLRHDWPGNVRELRNVIERACLLASDVIEPEHLLLNAARSETAPAVMSSPTLPPDVAVQPGRLRDAEQEMIMQTLHSCHGNKTRAAALLGISVKTLYNKLKRFEEHGSPTGAAAGQSI